MNRIENFEDVIGKTIKNIKKARGFLSGGKSDFIKIEFTDNTFIELVSEDFEGYRSFISIVDIENTRCIDKETLDSLR